MVNIIHNLQVHFATQAHINMTRLAKENEENQNQGAQRNLQVSDTYTSGTIQQEGHDQVQEDLSSFKLGLPKNQIFCRYIQFYCRVPDAIQMRPPSQIANAILQGMQA